jgi:hypothetical protein
MHWKEKIALTYTVVATTLFSGYATHHGIQYLVRRRDSNARCVHDWRPQS